MVVVHKKRNIYTVFVKGSSGKEQPIILTAENIHEMFNQLSKNYGHLFIDKAGNEVGAIEFRSSSFGNIKSHSSV
ncbi:hypothetical protein [Bacillus sp. V5-8f]|uniref:hypothetical protein n=1 Tax=Bacillus sp. V5-8f TaxID=2053044 RepID=UPI000C759946|nr:hypothetical protein [Bacillus sp. V5-8f]PLT33531.1 hypothetical protein CUU64_13260 [Bacillus sp. V5-8f]